MAFFTKFSITKIYKIDVQLKSTIICPHCGFKKEEEMPQDACQFFFFAYQSMYIFFK